MFSSFRFSSESVYWYCASLPRPPIWKSCCTCRKSVRAGNAGQLAAQAVNHLVGGRPSRPLADRLQRDEHAPHVGAATAGTAAADKGRDRRTAGSSSTICASFRCLSRIAES